MVGPGKYYSDKVILPSLEGGVGSVVECTPWYDMLVAVPGVGLEAISTPLPN